MSDSNQQVNPEGLLEPKRILETKEYFDQFIFIVWIVNPLRDNVRVVLDDGSIKMYLKRDKFEKIMTDILNETLEKDRQYTLFRIRESLRVYGGIFYYDRVKNDFREVREAVDMDNIRPHELMAESRKSLVKETINDNFKKSSKEYNDTIIDAISYEQPKKTFQQFINVVRNIGSKKKKPIL